MSTGHRSQVTGPMTNGRSKGVEERANKHWHIGLLLEQLCKLRRMLLYGTVRRCTVLYDNVWRCMAMYGDVLYRMRMYGVQTVRHTNCAGVQCTTYTIRDTDCTTKYDKCTSYVVHTVGVQHVRHAILLLGWSILV